MRLFQDRSKRLIVVKVAFMILCLLAWVGAGLGADPGTLPACAWNLGQMESLKVPGGDTLTFAVLGDNRSNPEVFGRVLRQLDCDPDLAFAIDVGDMVEQGTLEQFDEFFKHLRSAARLPFLTVVGNHDLGNNQDLTLYREIFGPDYYAFQLRDHYFIVLNDNLHTGMGEAQMAWLEQELRKSQSYKTRLVFLHIPLFDPRGGENHHCLPEATGRRLAALFHQYRVTHIVAGHIHSYFSGNWDGVPYTITAGAGAPLYGTDPAHYFYHYLKVTLKDGRVQIRVRRVAAPRSE
jgi:hypothetical protein